MGFESDLVARQVDDFEWKLVEVLEYRGNKDTFKVEAGFKTDFASVPMVFQWVIPRSGRFTRAAVLHDFLWRDGQISLADADGVFRRAMAESNVPFLRRWLMWAAVRFASLFKSWFSDGAKDFPRVLLIALVPGAPVILGGLVVLVLLLGFWVVELVAYGILATLYKVPAAKRRLKPPKPPTLFWSS